MDEFVARRPKVALITLVLVLVSLFAAFWLMNILEKPPLPRVIVLGTIRWNMTKPQVIQGVGEAFESRYENENGTVWVSAVITIDHYLVGGKDKLLFDINGSANGNLGYIKSMVINFSRTDNDSYLNMIEDWDFLAQAENLNVWKFDWGADSTNEGHIEAKAVGRPNFAYLRIVSEWIFFEKEASHSITVTLETTFFTETEHIKTVMPMLLEVNPS